MSVWVMIPFEVDRRVTQIEDMRNMVCEVGDTSIKMERVFFHWHSL